MLLLTACPVSSSLPLFTPGNSKIDKSLIGTWKNDSSSSEAQEVIITKSTDSTYGLKIVQKGELYMADSDTFNAWMGMLGNESYFVLQEVSAEGATETYYVYHIKLENSKLTTNDISLKVQGTEAITSIESYQNEVNASSKMEGFLSGEIVWKKK